MKRFVILLLTLALALSLAACSASTDDSGDKEPVYSTAADTKNSEATSTAKATDNKTDVKVKEQVIFEKDGFRVTVKSLDFDESLFGHELKLYIENDSNQNATFQVRNFSINDLMVDTMFSCDVAAGKKANDEITIQASDLETAKISTIKDIEFILHIFNTDTWDDIIDSDPIVIHTTADPSYVQAYDDSGFVALDNNGIRVVVKKLNSSDSFWGSDIYLYIENNSDKDVTIQAKDVSVNGFMVDPVFSCDIPKGKKVFDTMSFMESDLSDNNITEITSLELRFHVFDMDNWDDIFDSDIVTVTFK